jgi:hypothetical protein
LPVAARPHRIAGAERIGASPPWQAKRFDGRARRRVGPVAAGIRQLLTARSI